VPSSFLRENSVQRIFAPVSPLVKEIYSGNITDAENAIHPREKRRKNNVGEMIHSPAPGVLLFKHSFLSGHNFRG
jgi:hypothetical protein